MSHVVSLWWTSVIIIIITSEGNGKVLGQVLVFGDSSEAEMSDQTRSFKSSQSDSRDNHIHTSLHSHPPKMVSAMVMRGGQRGLLGQCVPRKHLTPPGREGFLEEVLPELKPAGRVGVWAYIRLLINVG